MTLRTRLLTAIAVVFVVLVAANVTTYVVLRARLIDRLDAQLVASTVPLMDAAKPLLGADTPKEAELRRVRDVAPTGSIVEVRRADGTVVATVGHDGAVVLDEITADAFGPSTRQIDGVPWRAQVLPLAAPPGPPGKGAAGSGLPGRLLVAAPFAPIDATLRTLLWIEAASTVAVLLVLAVVALLLIRRGLRPIERIARTATTITAGDLHQRLPEGRAGAEVGHLTLALNTMLDELQASFGALRSSEDRLRRFVSDASHELRTPLTAIRGYADLYRRGELRRPEDVTLAMHRIDEASIRMSVLVDELLLLARLDQGRPLERAEVDLAAVAADAMIDAAAVEPDRPLALTGQPSVLVVGDRDRLFQVIANLLTNVRCHTPLTAAVRLDVRTEGSDAIVEVHDDGPGMEPDVASRVFDRFFRADDARGGHTAGSGLGLSIVDAVVRAHGGTVTLRTAPGGGATFTVRLPARSAGDILRPPQGGLQGGSRFDAHR